jgi:hypothetical protein
MACTSNRKFLSLHDEVYKNQTIYMMKNGIDNNNTVPNNNFSSHPESVKTGDDSCKECKTCKAF